MRPIAHRGHFAVGRILLVSLVLAVTGLFLNPAMLFGQDYYATRQQGIDAANRGDYDLAISCFSDAIRLKPGSAEAYSNRGTAYDSKGDYDKAIGDYDQAIQLDPKYTLAYNGFAWLLATCPQSGFRDGKKAVEYAKKACELSEWKHPSFFDTLAAGCAEAGDFENAVKFEKKYLEAPQLSEKDSQDAKRRLALYKDHKPYRAGK